MADYVLLHASDLGFEIRLDLFSDLDFKVRLDLFSFLNALLQNVIIPGVVRIQRELLHHKIDPCIIDTVNLLHRILNLLCARCAVDLAFVFFLHSSHLSPPFSGQTTYITALL